MTSIVKYVLVLCVLFVAGYTNAQITINTNFSVLSNQPIDSRDTLTTLADTSSVTWTFPGLLSYVVDIDEFWYYTGTQWRKLFDGTTIPSTVPDSLIVYAPAHGLSDTIALYGYVPVKADFTRANSTSIDSVFIAYAIDAPDTDSLTLIFSGVLTYGSWHGKELNTQYYLQDDGSDDTTPGTVSVPTAIASDSLTLFLREVGSDIAGQLRRVAMPSPLITAFGGNPASPTDAVVQAAIEGAYLPAGLAQPGTIFTLSYATQSYNPTYQQTAPNTNPLTPSYAWLWDGAYATRIVNIPTSVNLQDVSYGVLGTLVLLPIDSLMAASVPTDTEVALWLDTNYTANNLRLANGSLLYFIGDSTRQNPEYIWQVIDDISYDAGDTDWEKILKRIKSPVVAADGNGLFDAANDGDTIRATSAYFTELELSHTNGDGQFTLSDGQLNVLLESQEEIAGTRTMLLLDTLGISKLGLQTPSKESWVGFDYTIGDSLGLLVMIDSIYPDSGQILIAGPDSLFRFGSLPSGADGNGLIDALPAGDVTINAENNALVIDSASYILQRGTGSLIGFPHWNWYNFMGFGEGSSFFGIESSANGSSQIATSFEITGLDTIFYAQMLYVYDSTGNEVRVDKHGVQITADTLDATGVTTFLGFPSGTDSQTLSTSNDSLTISGGNTVKLPITELLRDSVTTTTMTIDLETRYQKVVQIDMATATNLTLTINNPTNAGVYTFHFIGTSGTDNVTWPAAFLDAAGTALGTDALTTGTMYTCYYSSTDAKYYCK